MKYYKYNIKHKLNNKTATINFKNERTMIKYLDKHIIKINNLVSPALYFGMIMLPLKQTKWFDGHLQSSKNTV